MTPEEILFHCTESCDGDDALYCMDCVEKVITEIRQQEMNRKILVSEEDLATREAKGFTTAKLEETKRALAQAQKEVLLREQCVKEARNGALEEAVKIVKEKEILVFLQKHLANQKLITNVRETLRKSIIERIRALKRD